MVEPGTGPEADTPLASPRRNGNWLAHAVREAILGSSPTALPLPDATVEILRAASSAAQRLSTPLFLVGGAVRDLLLDRANLVDIDLVVVGQPSTVLDLVRTLNATVGGKTRTHERFGTAALFLQGGPRFDFAMARTERYPRPAALPLVAPGTVEQDLLRRDFAINAMAVRIDPAGCGEFLDPAGGCKDLATGTIRILHDASFLDDPTRLFRAVQYEARLGFTMDGATESLARRAMAERLPMRLSHARLRTAVSRAWSEEEIVRVAERLVDLGIVLCFDGGRETGGQRRRAEPSTPCRTRSSRNLLRARLPRVDAAWHTCQEANQVRPLSGPTLHLWEVRLMEAFRLLGAGGVPHHLGTRLFSPRATAQAIARWWEVADKVVAWLSSPDPVAPSELVERLEPLGMAGWVGAWAEAADERAEARLSAYLTVYRHVEPPLSGEALLALGMRPGPHVSEMLRVLRRKALNQGLDTKGAEAFVRSALGARHGTRSK